MRREGSREGEKERRKREGLIKKKNTVVIQKNEEIMGEKCV